MSLRSIVSRLFVISIFSLALATPFPVRAGGWMWNMPPNTVWLDSGQRNNVFYVGEPVSFKPSSAAAVRYDVRDYWGNLIDQGPVGSVISPKVTQPGWYKIYVYGSAAQSPWGYTVGGAMFSILRPDPNFPPLPAQNVSGGADPLIDLVMRGAAAIGPLRHKVDDVTNPAAAIAKIDAEIAIENQWYAQTDPVRPRPIFIAFSNGTQQSLDGVRQIVAHFKNVVKYWEPRNEPNDIAGNLFAVNEMKPFYDAVKSVDPTAKVMGPGVVSLALLPWIEQFLQGGGGNCIDAFSFHAYNNVNGDVWLARKCLDDLNTLLTKYGVQNKEKWQTEQGYFAAVYGLYQPRLQGRWTMVQMMTYEQYGIPKEHNNLWYDRSGGFWDFPTWWSNGDGSLNPGAALMRVWSEELFGKQFVKALDFGTPGNQLYIGSQFAGSGKQVFAFMSAGSTDGSVVLNVPGVSSVHVVSAFGVEQDMPVVNGTVTLPVPELPVYVETPAALTVTPINLGKNLTQTSGVTASGNSVAGPPPVEAVNDPSRVVNGFLESPYYGPNDVWRLNTQAFPAWVDISFPVPTTMDHVIIYAGVPWSTRGSLLDYDLQYQAANGQFVTLQTVTEPTKSFQAYTPINVTNEDSFYSDRWIFQHSFAPVTTQKLRINVRDVTYGGTPTAEAQNAGGEGGLHQLTLREVEVYSSGTSQASSPPVAMNDTASTTTGTPVTINVLANDSDPGHGPNPLNIQSVSTPGNGSAVISNGQVVYTPNAAFSGTDSFNYTITDGAATASAGVSVAVTKPVVVVGSGTGLKGDYFIGQDLTTLKLTRIDPTVNFDWSAASPDPSIPQTHFSVRWTGQVQAQYNESYTFYTYSDDGIRLWVNGVQVINDWTDHGPYEDSGTIALVAGQKYDIKLEYYQNAGGANARLSWSSPSQVKQVIPQTQLYPAAGTVTPTPPLAVNDTGNTTAGVPVTINVLANDSDPGKGPSPLSIQSVSTPANGTASIASGQVVYTPKPGFSGTDSFNYTISNGAATATAGVTVTVNKAVAVVGTGTGLKGDYFIGQDLTTLKLTRIDPTVNYDWSAVSPDPSVPQTHFSVRWTGQAQAQYTETYTFYTLSDDGIRLWINGVQVINDWTDHGPYEDNGTIALIAGQKYDIKLEYYQNTGGANARLSWSSPSQAKQVIPQSQLYPAPGTVTLTPPLAVNDTATTTAGVPVNINVLSNDSDPGKGPSPLSIQSVTSPVNGTAVISNGQVLYTPNAAFSGTDSFNYTISNGAATASAGVTVTVNRTVAGVGSGTGLKGDYFIGQDLTTLKLTRIDPTVNFDWSTVSPDPSIPQTHFSVRWTGQVQPQFNEIYTFYTYSDDGIRLWVNGVQVINDWTDHGPYEDSGTIALVAGQKYDIKLEYYQNAGGANARLSWSSPSQVKQVIPQTQLYPASGTVTPTPPIAVNDTASTTTGVPITINVLANDSDPGHGPSPLSVQSVSSPGNGTAVISNGQVLYTPNPGFGGTDSFNYTISNGAATATASVAVTVSVTPPVGTPGLQGDYFTSQDLTALKLSRTDQTVNFDWGFGSPDPSIPADHFSVRWTGTVQAPATGVYTFYTDSDDGIRLWVNNQLLVNNWTDHGVTENSGTITLQAGQQYSIRIEFYDDTLSAVAKLLWAPPGQAKQVVPASVLAH